MSDRGHASSSEVAVVPRLGFSPAEGGGREEGNTYWMGPEGMIEVSLCNPSDSGGQPCRQRDTVGYLVEIPLALAPHLEQPLQVTFRQGNEVVLSTSLESEASITLFLSIAPGPNHIKIACEGTILSPADLGVSDDTRKISFAITIGAAKILNGDMKASQPTACFQG